MAKNLAPDMPNTGRASLADTEQALRDSEARLRSIIETVPDALVLIDEQGLIQSFSPAAERLFGFSEAEVVGRNVSMLMPSPYREQHDDYLARYLRTGERRIIGIGRVVVGQRADGSTFPMELQVGEVKLRDHRLFTGFVRDITERQTTRERLHELQSELLRTSRLSAMGQMASALAHELNQPLTAVINYIQACRQLLAAQDAPASERLRETMDKAVVQASRAGQIIRRMRQFIQKGETDRQFESINQVVEEASALALVGARESGILVRMELSPDLPPVLVDRIQIQQVVVNLVRNGMEALGASPRRELTIRTARADDDVEVAVSDTGPGLSPEVTSQLFQPFITTKPKGMGLGLSISRSIVEAHGGRLQAAPNLEGGVTFLFFLPLPRS